MDDFLLATLAGAISYALIVVVIFACRRFFAHACVAGPPTGRCMTCGGSCADVV